MPILLAVSGGADSVAMLRLLMALWQRSAGCDCQLVAVAHYNHGLRGQASDQDQRFVAELASSLGLRYFTQTAASINPRQSEASLRTARYDFLQATAANVGARCLLVAHTADDNVETMLHHLFRGTGTAGLAGMAPHRALGEDFLLVRPMLAMWRADLRQGLAEIGQSWREDLSNLDDRYQRNWIRGTLLPLVRDRYPHADKAVLRAIENQSDYRQWLESAANQWIVERVTQCQDGLTLSRGDVSLVTLSTGVRLLWDRLRWPRQAMSASHLRRLHKALVAPIRTGAFTLPGDIQCRVSSEQITLHRGR